MRKGHGIRSGGTRCGETSDERPSDSRRKERGAAGIAGKVRYSTARDVVDGHRARRLPRPEAPRVSPASRQLTGLSHLDMGPEGVEPTTSCSGGKRSIQLSYGPLDTVRKDWSTRVLK